MPTFFGDSLYILSALFLFSEEIAAGSKITASSELLHDNNFQFRVAQLVDGKDDEQKTYANFRMVCFHTNEEVILFT